MLSDKHIKICGHGSGFPSIKNLNEYSENRYNQKASNGVRKQIVAVRRLKTLKDADRIKFHDTYMTILGRNIYDQNLRQYVYTPYNKMYYSDCSSSGCATYKKIGYDVPLLNTAGIYTSNLFETVPVEIKNGHIVNAEVLKVGDAILFAGSDPSRPKQIGHVEYVYEILDGWTKHYDGSWHYYVDGKQITDKWMKINAKWYRFDSDGKMLTGWYSDGHLWYFFNNDGSMAAYQWVEHKDKWYYLDANGVMATNCYVKSSKSIEKYYWLDENGVWDDEKTTENVDLNTFSIVR